MKVGDYVRTKKGIAKIIDRVNDPTNYFDRFWVCDRYLEINGDTEYIHEQDVIGEPKENIIDLIEVGDYVNGVRVEYIDDCRGAMREYYYIFEDETHDAGHYEEEIKTVVTKEQFSQMEYKVGD